MELIEKSFSEMLEEKAKKDGEKTAIVFGKTTYTYRDFFEAVELCAKDWEARIKPGDHVALWSVNSANWLICFFGIIRAGGVAVPINYGLAAEQVVGMCQFSDVKHIACGINKETMQNPKVAYEVANQLGIGIDHIYPIADNMVDYHERINQQRTLGEKIDSPSFKEQDMRRTAMIVFTSGSTATPKAVQLSQYSMLNNVRDVSLLFHNARGESLLVGIPLFHAYGLELAILYLFEEATIYLSAQLKPDVFLSLIKQHEITDFFSVNVLYYGMLAQPNLEQIAPVLKICGVGGSFTPPAKMMAFAMAFPNAAVLCGYGQSETGTMISLTTPDLDLDRRSSSVGKTIPGCEVKIWDEKDGFLSQGKVGEVVVKGYTVMNGYYKGTKEQEVIDENGWLHTGDLGYYDEDGILFLVGRVKDIIIKNGENISPVEIESKVTQCKGVLDAKVLGAPHSLFGENIEACVVMKPGQTFDEKTVRAQLKGELSSFKTPEHFFVYPGFPLNSNGKLDVKELQRDMLEQLNGIRIKESLEGGICALETTMKNISYNIVPVASMAEQFAESFGFGKKQAVHIRLAVEEMLLERIENAYEDVGNITIKIVLREEYFSILFQDQGKLFQYEQKEDDSYSIAIILKVADDFHTEYTKQKTPVYCMDFKYENDFDVATFLGKYSQL